jgi:hypothetical protein
MRVLLEIYSYLWYCTELLGDRDSRRVIESRLEQFTSIGDSNKSRNEYLRQLDDDYRYYYFDRNTGDCRDEDSELDQFEWEQRKIVSERILHFQKAKYHRHRVRRSKDQRT